MNALSLVAVVGSALGAAGIARAVWLPTPRLADRVRPYNQAGRSALGLAPDVASPRDDVVREFFAPMVGSTMRAVSRRLESRSDDELQIVLFRAGRLDLDVEQYRVRQVARGVLGALAFGAIASLVLRTPVGVIAFVVVGFVWGTSRVRAELDRSIARRTEQIRLELVTVTALLALQIHTGSGLVQAVQRFSERGRGIVANELRAVTKAIRSGTREAEAFRRAAELTGAPEAARMYGLFANGVERGADLAGALLALADDLRDARRDDVKRRAVRARAAMLLPTIGILAPVMLLFIAAPLPSIVFGTRCRGARRVVGRTPSGWRRHHRDDSRLGVVKLERSERGAVTVQFVAATAFGFVLLVLVANLFVDLYVRGAVRDALDEGVRAGAIVDGAGACRAEIDETLAALIGDGHRNGIEIECASGLDGWVRATARVRLRSWLPGIPDWQFTLRSAARIRA